MSALKCIDCGDPSEGLFCAACREIAVLITGVDERAASLGVIGGESTWATFT